MFHPAPSVTGSIDGKPFTPKVGRILKPVMADGRVAISLTEGNDCSSKPGDATLTLVVPWSNGYKVDLSALKRATKTAPNEFGLSRAPGSYSTTLKPSGTLTVLKAPTAKDATGKMKIDMQAGDYILAGDLDVLVCVPAK